MLQHMSFWPKVSIADYVIRILPSETRIKRIADCEQAQSISNWLPWVTEKATRYASMLSLCGIWCLDSTPRSLSSMCAPAVWDQRHHLSVCTIAGMFQRFDPRQMVSNRWTSAGVSAGNCRQAHETYTFLVLLLF